MKENTILRITKSDNCSNCYFNKECIRECPLEKGLIFKEQEHIYEVETIDWNDEKEIEGIFPTEEQAKDFASKQPEGYFRRYINEIEINNY